MLVRSGKALVHNLIISYKKVKRPIGTSSAPLNIDVNSWSSHRKDIIAAKAGFCTGCLCSCRVHISLIIVVNRSYIRDSTEKGGLLMLKLELKEAFLHDVEEIRSLSTGNWYHIIKVKVCCWTCDFEVPLICTVKASVGRLSADLYYFGQQRITKNNKSTNFMSNRILW